MLVVACNILGCQALELPMPAMPYFLVAELRITEKRRRVRSASTTNVRMEVSLLRRPQFKPKLESSAYRVAVDV